MSPFILFLLAASIPITIKSQLTPLPQKVPLSHMCEIVVVFDDSFSTHEEDFDHMINFVHQIPDVIRIGPDHGRVAVVIYSDNAIVAMNLTDDEFRIRTFRTARHPGISHTHLGLKAAREILVRSRSGALKIVVLISDGRPSIEPITDDQLAPTEKEAEELKKSGIIIYYAFVGTHFGVDPVSTGHAYQVTGDSSQVFQIENYSQLTADVLRRVQSHFICRFDEICRFNDTNCDPDWWRPAYEVTVTCSNPKPTRPFRIRCQDENCTELCDKWWKWNECVPGVQSGNVNVSREEPEPSTPLEYRPLYEHCPRTKEIFCPAAPSTPPLTPATTSAPNPSSPTSTLVPTTSVPNPSSPTSTTSGPNPTTTPAPSTEKESPPTPTTSVPNPSSTTAIQVQTTEKPSSPIFIVVVITVIVFGILIAIVVAVLFVLRNRKKQKKHLTAAELKKAHVEMEKKKSHVELETKTQKIKSPDGRSLGVRTGAVGAESSMAVSLREKPGSPQGSLKSAGAKNPVNLGKKTGK